MGVGNCSEIGYNLQKIMKRLMANEDLVKLLYYTDKDPLSNEPLTDAQIKSEVYEKLLKVVPRVGPKEDSHSIVVIRVSDGRSNKNGSFRDITLNTEVFVPLTQWIIKDDNLRPFKIMGEVQKSLVGTTVNGLGKIDGGDFELNFLTEEMSCYMQTFNITTYD